MVDKQKDAESATFIVSTNVPPTKKKKSSKAAYVVPLSDSPSFLELNDGLRDILKAIEKLPPIIDEIRSNMKGATSDEDAIEGINSKLMNNKIVVAAIKGMVELIEIYMAVQRSLDKLPRPQRDRLWYMSGMFNKIAGGKAGLRDIDRFLSDATFKFEDYTVEVDGKETTMMAEDYAKSMAVLFSFAIMMKKESAIYVNTIGKSPMQIVKELDNICKPRTDRKEIRNTFIFIAECISEYVTDNLHDLKTESSHKVAVILHNEAYTRTPYILLMILSLFAKVCMSAVKQKECFEAMDKEASKFYDYSSATPNGPASERPSDPMVLLSHTIFSTFISDPLFNCEGEAGLSTFGKTFGMDLVAKCVFKKLLTEKKSASTPSKTRRQEIPRQIAASVNRNTRSANAHSEDNDDEWDHESDNRSAIDDESEGDAPYSSNEDSTENNESKLQDFDTDETSDSMPRLPSSTSDSENAEDGTVEEEEAIMEEAKVTAITKSKATGKQVRNKKASSGSHSSHNRKPKANAGKKRAPSTEMLSPAKKKQSAKETESAMNVVALPKSSIFNYESPIPSSTNTQRMLPQELQQFESNVSESRPVLVIEQHSDCLLTTMVAVIMNQVQESVNKMIPAVGLAKNNLCIHIDCMLEFIDRFNTICKSVEPHRPSQKQITGVTPEIALESVEYKPVGWNKRAVSLQNKELLKMIKFSIYAFYCQNLHAQDEALMDGYVAAVKEMKKRFEKKMSP